MLITRYNNKRNVFAILLLMVMMLQMGIKTLHHHHYEHKTEFFCSDCENHKVHDGHFLDWEGDTDDCMLCQLLQTPYIPALEIPVVHFSVRIHVNDIIAVPEVFETAWCAISLRGPPSDYYNKIV